MTNTSATAAVEYRIPVDPRDETRVMLAMSPMLLLILTAIAVPVFKAHKDEIPMGLAIGWFAFVIVAVAIGFTFVLRVTLAAERRFDAYVREAVPEEQFTRKQLKTLRSRSALETERGRYMRVVNHPRGVDNLFFTAAS